MQSRLYTDSDTFIKFLVYLTYVFYVPEDGHNVGRDMQQFIVYIKPILVQLCAFVGPLFCIFSPDYLDAGESSHL
jgi:hypothetical protein